MTHISFFFFFQVFPGPTDPFNPVTNLFDEPIFATEVRIYIDMTKPSWRHKFAALRFELHGQTGMCISIFSFLIKHSVIYNKAVTYNVPKYELVYPIKALETTTTNLRKHHFIIPFLCLKVLFVCFFFGFSFGSIPPP